MISQGACEFNMTSKLLIFVHLHTTGYPMYVLLIMELLSPTESNYDSIEDEEPDVSYPTH